MSKSFPTVGVIGAGQLARMSIAPATALGVNLLLLAADSNDSAAQITDHVVGDYSDLTTVRQFAAQCDVITFEHELIPLSIIKALEADGVVVRPSSAAFEFSQDKAAMRQKLQGFASPKFQIVTTVDQVSDFPVIAKAISGGYDGRGVWKVNSAKELGDLLQKMPKLLVEELIEFDYEIAVMVARSPHGQATTWAPTQTVQKDGICVMTISPAPLISAARSDSGGGPTCAPARLRRLCDRLAIRWHLGDNAAGDGLRRTGYCVRKCRQRRVDKRRADRADFPRRRCLRA